MVIFSGIKFYARLMCAASVAILCLAFSGDALAAPSLKAILDRETIALGESATLSLTFTDAPSVPPPSLPGVPNLQIQHTGQASQFQSINGVNTSSLIHTYSLTPAAIGEFVIPPLRVNVNGTFVSTLPLKLKVTEGNVTSADEKLPAFLKLINPKKQVYVGEPIVVELQLYCQDARDLNMPQLPGNGFAVGTIPQPAQSRTRIGSEVYNLVIFKIPVTATRAGSLSLGPASMNLELLTGPRNFFGQFSQARRVALQSEPQALQVLPLPTADQPLEFNGAIGSFSLEFSAAPTNVAVGDPITIKAKISGRGSLDLLSLPPQKEWREFKTYPATSKIEANDPLGFEGAKIFEQVVVPQNSAVQQLPPFAFSFFDPEQKTYRTLTHPAIALTVRPAAAMPQPTVFSNQTEDKTEKPAPEIVHIKPQMGSIRANPVPLIQQPWFWALQSLPPMLWLGAVIHRRRKENLANNPKLLRQRVVEKLVNEEMQKLRTQANANQSDEFFATVFRLLQEQIGERLDLPASSITESVVDEDLKKRGMSLPSLAGLHELFQACNQARYAPIRSSQQLASFIPKVEEAIVELKKVK